MEDPGERVLRDLGYDSQGRYRPTRTYFDMGRGMKWGEVAPGIFEVDVPWSDPDDGTAGWTRGDWERDLDESILNGSGHEANGMFNEIELKRASDGTFRRGGDALT